METTPIDSDDAPDQVAAVAVVMSRFADAVLVWSKACALVVLAALALWLTWFLTCSLV